MGVGFIRSIPLADIHYKLFIYRSSETNELRHVVYATFYARDNVQLAQISVSGKSIKEVYKRANIYLLNFKITVDVNKWFKPTLYMENYSKWRRCPFMRYCATTYQINEKDLSDYFHSLFKSVADE